MLSIQTNNQGKPVVRAARELPNKQINTHALVEIGKMIFRADFVIIDMHEEKEAPVILGRPFLATSGALIDVPRGEIVFRFRGNTLSYNVCRMEDDNPIITRMK